MLFSGCFPAQVTLNSSKRGLTVTGEFWTYPGAASWLVLVSVGLIYSPFGSVFQWILVLILQFLLWIHDYGWWKFWFSDWQWDLLLEVVWLWVGPSGYSIGDFCMSDLHNFWFGVALCEYGKGVCSGFMTRWLEIIPATSVWKHGQWISNSGQLGFGFWYYCSWFHSFLPLPRLPWAVCF